MKTLGLLLILFVGVSCTVDESIHDQTTYTWVYFNQLYVWQTPWSSVNQEYNPSGGFSDASYKLSGVKRFDTLYNLTEAQAYERYRMDSARVFVKSTFGPGWKCDFYKYQPNPPRKMFK